MYVTVLAVCPEYTNETVEFILCNTEENDIKVALNKIQVGSMCTSHGTYQLAGNIAMASTINQTDCFIGFHHGLLNPLTSR